ncbi:MULTISPECIES: type II toxin-antitoxin system RelE/ParE family toxin [unclassified Mesorhizobium]|uniref:type II toxin-antitoxin system RelE/ParE family toxin n=1 Tax=unclassified Mesorhizobium TaxID=325217 RepID=UPI000F75BAF9|nr:MULTISPECIES: type II toxin-antitoxin system RelE/ParE family toxin [unclassified Mesorhizobium]AZO24970.1 type II toxin-antitoxin system RelE/ParE family toxin [Mesorhizobium sp. M1E.F.Ca.ET.045.02.1.1]RWD93504.1 MAG: type II toxin-antitoxin system RelE/ParE family toxin [Mesorhizobium sp.]TIV55076.1 MAG: type II toxin-antitoxin system RelE/ParE family toxin [Mesorhizobium sp.]
MAVTFSPAAARDVEEIGDYIHAENPAAARRFLAALRVRCGRIADAPRGGALRSSLMPSLRSIPFQHYVVFYMAEGDNVRIERVLHGARDIEAVFDEDGDV